MVADAVIISDFHLGSRVCESELIISFLKKILNGEIPTRQLVLNGDIIDCIKSSRFTKQHWRILSLLKQIAFSLPVVWIAGNHDAEIYVIKNLIEGIIIREGYTVLSGGQDVLVLHGHQFDTFLASHPLLTSIANYIYKFIQWVDPSHNLARRAKHSSKMFLHCSSLIKDRAKAYAAKLGYSKVICGHTHHPLIDVSGRTKYYNSGCWTERPGTYLMIKSGKIDLHQFN